MMTNAHSPTATQLDALRELANVGCGSAANALSRLVGGRRIWMDVPRVLVARPQELPLLIGGENAPVLAACFALMGDLAGEMILLVPESDAESLCALLLRTGEKRGLELAQRSAFSEAANIVASACLNGVSAMTRLRLLPSVPRLAQDAAGAVLKSALPHASPDDERVVVLETKLHAEQAPEIHGRLLLIPQRKSLKKLFDTLGV